MKKKILFMAFAVLSICTASAQDSTHNATTKKVHKKAVHTNSTTMSMDSVNGGKIVTNPHGKVDSKSSAIKRKTTKSTTGSNSTDSTK